MPGHRVDETDGWLQDRNVDARTERVPVKLLRAADSPRSEGENDEHVRQLADSVNELPPILVHRATMRVIDGMHRLKAVIRRGGREVEVRFFDGDEHDAFVLGVQANIAHGLPLPTADRTRAAERILASHPHWSDRRVAQVAGLAPNTVAAVRRRSTVQSAQTNTRVGQDGRARPVSAAQGRVLAGRLLTENPTASLREIARAAGIAPSTVLDVRQRLASGRAPVPGKDRAGPPEPRSPEPEPDAATVWQQLSRDPAMRFTEAGRRLLAWLRSTSADLSDWPQLMERVPAHCAPSVADLARRNAEALRRIADELDRAAS